MRLISWTAVGLFLLSAGGPAGWAALGGDAASVDADRQALSCGASSPATFSNYRVEEFNNNGGMTVREYLNASGTVFAVTWNGGQQPDLKVLLGGHFSDYEKALGTSQRSAGRQSHFAVKGPDLVLERSGHMRSLHGRAYLPSLLPTGVTANAIL